MVHIFSCLDIYSYVEKKAHDEMLLVFRPSLTSLMTFGSDFGKDKRGKSSGNASRRTSRSITTISSALPLPSRASCDDITQIKTLLCQRCAKPQKMVWNSTMY